MSGKKYILLDRDGTIIREKHYLSSPEELELLPGAAAGLRLLQQAGYGLIVITNQSAVGRGYLTEDRLQEIHATLKRALLAENVCLDAIFYCPHAPQENCSCRKPKTAMVERAAAEFHFKPEDAIMIGDKPCDVDLGKRFGSKTVLVRSGYGREHENSGLKADLICDDLIAAADALISSN